MHSKIFVIKSNEYNLEYITNEVEKAINYLGGLKNLIPENDKVLIKPNMLKGSSPEKVATTHPVIFEAVVSILKKNNYKIVYGDSPGFGSPKQVAQACKLDGVAVKYGIELADFERGEVVSFKEGKKSKQFEIAQAVLDADSIISLPKMKSHQFTRITGALKNQLGCVYGLNKAAFHIKFPNVIDFSRMLVDLHLLLKNKLKLFIMDGIVAMEGNGPGSGSPVKMNTILVSDNPFAIDYIFCKLVDINPDYLHIFKMAKEEGLFDQNDIEISGEPIENLINKNFDVVRKPLKDEAILGFLKPFKNLMVRKPYIKKELCKKCGVCVEACPVEGKAIKQKNKNSIPKYDYNKCIRCYCCQEMCPFKAIEVKMPLLGFLVYR